MARLQDFQTVTPTASDKLLVVQSQGQGLVSYGSKIDTANPTGTGSFSLNRKANTTVGAYSVAEGLSCTASGNSSHAEGYNNTAIGSFSHAEGSGNNATADQSHAEGYTTTASGSVSHAEGVGTIANHLSQHVFGQYNVADTSTAAATLRGNYIEVVGKGTSDANRSNARTLDWSGNEVLAGDLTINGSTSVATALGQTVKRKTITTTSTAASKIFTIPSDLKIGLLIVGGTTSAGYSIGVVSSISDVFYLHLEHNGNSVTINGNELTIGTNCVHASLIYIPN